MWWLETSLWVAAGQYIYVYLEKYSRKIFGKGIDKDRVNNVNAVAFFPCVNVYGMCMFNNLWYDQNVYNSAVRDGLQEILLNVLAY